MNFYLKGLLLSEIRSTQIALCFVQEQGESAEFIGINEHFQRSS